MEQQIRFCAASDGARLAYATYGNDSATPLLFMLAWLSQERIWSHPEGRAFLEALARVRRLVTYDYRGMGASQRDAIPKHPIQENVSDLFSVVDAAGIDSFDLFSIGSMGVAAAAREPARVNRLILFGPGPVKAGYSEKTLQMIRDQWGLYTRASASVIYPEGSGEALRWISDAARSSGGQEYITANGSGRFDYRPLLPSISCPTLILHREHDQNHRIDEGRRLAAMIADARFVGLPGGSHHPMWAHSDYMPVLYEFLGAAGSAYRTGHRPSGTTTILFTDLVGHTEMMQQLGDAKGRAVLREHERITRETLTRHGGSEVKTMGDGFMASFPTATSAVECAVTLHRAIAAWSGNAPGTTSPFPLPIRVGLNAGEPIEEGGDLFGTSVIMAARVAAHAGPGDILLPEPVRHLLAGKGFAFIDCGTTALKGFDEPVRLFRVEWRT